MRKAPSIPKIDVDVMMAMSIVIPAIAPAKCRV